MTGFKAAYASRQASFAAVARDQIKTFVNRTRTSACDNTSHLG